MTPFSSYNEDRFASPGMLILLITIAYLFSFGMRMIWIDAFNGFDEMYWNGQLMINTNDGYYFASAVQHLLSGMHAPNPQIQVALQSYPAVIYTTFFAVKFLPFTLESVILYMPAIVSSLIVIPIILTTRLFGMPLLGFFASLLASITVSYYNRTMVGYYDSDMFAVLMQMMILYSLAGLLIRRGIVYAVMSFTFIALYPYFYPQGLSLIYAMFFIYLAYTLGGHLLYARRNQIKHKTGFTVAATLEPTPLMYMGIALIAIALSPVLISLKILAGILLVALYYFQKLSTRHWLYIALAGILFFVFNANVFALISSKIAIYLERGSENEGLQFFQVIQTVREAGGIDFETMSYRISGSVLGVATALMGYILLLIRKPQFIIALPLIGVGIFALWGGLRFTIYAVPVAAIGTLFFFYVLADYIKNRIARYIAIVLLTAAVLYPNVIHIVNYKVPTVFTAKEVSVLDELKRHGSDKDYVIAWWDYGYPLWFYTDKNTLIDGGKHHHDNYIVSKILTTDSQTEAANLSRIAVETYVSSDYKEVADTLFKNKQPDQVDVETYLLQLRVDGVELPKPTRDVYLFLPYRMMDILPTVTLFSNLNLNSPDNRQEPFFYPAPSVQDTGKTLELGNGISILKEKSILKMGSKEVPIKEFYQVGYDRTNTLRIQRQQFATEGLNVIYMPSYGRWLVIDDFYLNSTYIQMFVFENYDKTLFEPVVLSPLIKVYKNKR